MTMMALNWKTLQVCLIFSICLQAPVVFGFIAGATNPINVSITAPWSLPSTGTPAPDGTTARPGTAASLLARKCTFESSIICGYTQDRTDNFDWNWHTGGTSSAYTGPSSDHTNGTRRGHYMYTEASYPRKLGDKARLMSPTYIDDSDDICVQFWYHIYGNGIGTLNVYAQHGPSRGPALFSVTGNKGNKWILGTVPLPQSTTSKGYKVVFEGVVGLNHMSDIAIDDVSFTSGVCAGNCDFEHGLCTWTNMRNGDDFDWIQGSSSTTSGNTGPASDHTLGTLAGAAEQSIWQLSGNQGNTWKHAQASISQSASSYRVIFEGKRGTSYLGDIAIDDVVFTTSTCGGTEKGGVISKPTTNSRKDEEDWTSVVYTKEMDVF